MTKRIGRLLGLVLSLVLGLALESGCGNSGPAEEDGQENASGHAAGKASGGRGGGGGTSGGGIMNSGGNQPGAGHSDSGGRAGGDAPPQSGGRAGSGGMRAREDLGFELPPIPDLPASTNTTAPFFPEAFAAGCVPDTIQDRPETDGHHRQGEDCMTSGCHLNPKTAKHLPETDCRGSGCHADGSPDGSGAPAFLFGGTVYRAATMASAPGVQVGVSDTHGFYSACSAENGNFWYLAPSDVTSLAWSSATTRLRDANGGAPMMTTPAAGCSAASCHTDKMRITAP